MNFKDIKEFTYFDNQVIVDGVQVEISISLPKEIDAVQFHKGNDFCIEEPKMNKVDLEFYQFAIDEFEKKRNKS